MISTRSLVTQAFTDYNTNSSPQANDDIVVVSEVSRLYDRSSSFADRYAAAESLRSRGAFGTVSNYNRFIQDLNTERAFAGNYEMNPVR